MRTVGLHCFLSVSRNAH